MRKLSAAAIFMAALLIGCASEPEAKEEIIESNQVVKSVRLKSNDNTFSYRKIYVIDQQGYTHEILLVSGRITEAIELCKYKK